MLTKTWNLYLVCIIVLFAGCAKSRNIDHSEDDGGDTAPLSADDGGDDTAPLFEEISVLGTWRGYAFGEGSGDTWMFEFSENEATVSTSGIEAYKGRYHINTDVVPYQADFYIDSSSIPGLPGKISLGIFKIEGNVMTVAAAAPGQPERPEVFEPSSDGLIRVWKLEKQ